MEMHADGDMSLQRIDRGRVIVIVRRLCHRAVEEESDLDAMADDAFAIRRLLDNTRSRAPTSARFTRPLFKL
ncbi:hypothetical protein [Rhizobium leguminosarum]|uniref:hypothetical protein n=1 Tax=Rhizobium leguminosarum TaxID=384 RepID=UPI001ABF7544|nr:hypothetical protein [Rhizobium leguminosarum]